MELDWKIRYGIDDRVMEGYIKSSVELKRNTKSLVGLNRNIKSLMELNVKMNNYGQRGSHGRIYKGVQRNLMWKMNDMWRWER